MPISLTVEPTNFCNLHCTECPTGNNSLRREKGFLKISDYKNIIDTLSPWLFYQMIYLQGEPFLHPQIFNIITYAHQQNIYTCTSTNGHFITHENAQKIIESGLDKIIISVDGVNQETYEKYRKGGELQKVVSGIKILSNLKKKYQTKYPKIIIQFLVFRFNEHQVKEIKFLGKSIGANKVELKTAQIESVNDKLDLLPRNNRYSRYTSKNNHTLIKNKLKNRCFRIWSTIVTTWEGDVIPCCFDKNANHKMGNMHKNNLIEIWQSSGFNRFRHTILTNRKKIKMCNNCTSGLRI
ncbi:MAG: radical SAM protein [Bacteroidota bacterium]|nr:radical SAM protein [Bacteroidota bacterium]